jgi:hypothetical protein
MNPDDYLPNPVTAESVLETLLAAFFDAKIDSDGDVRIEGFPLMFVSCGGQELRLLNLFGTKPGRTRLMQLEFVNRINDEMKIPRLSLHRTLSGDNILIFDWYIPTTTPLSKRELVMAVRRFIDVMKSIGRLDTDDVVG